MTKRILGLIEFSFILIIAVVISACSQGTPIATSAPVSTTALITTTPPSTNLVSSKPIVLPGDTVIARSAIFINYTLEDLIKNTGTAVIGKVTEIYPAKQDEKRLPQIYFYTDVVIQAERYLYGGSQDRITVRVVGGRIGDIAMTSGDEAEFSLGEDCIVFLTNRTAPEGNTDENYYTVYADAKFNVRDGILVNNSDKKFSLSDVEQEIAKIQKK